MLCQHCQLGLAVSGLLQPCIRRGNQSRKKEYNLFSSIALAAVADAQAEMGLSPLPETVAPLPSLWHPAPYDKDAPIFLTNPHNPLQPITIFRAMAHKMIINKM
jgi:hypothetical protein